MKRIIVIFVILVLALSVVLYGDYAEIRVLDTNTGRYIIDPDIVMSPEVQLVGQPGTGGAGPYLYELVIPMPVTITVSAEGYRTERKHLFLNKWVPAVIYLQKE